MSGASADSGSGARVGVDADPDLEARDIGWLRAIATSVAIVLVAFLGVAFIPQKLLGSLSSMSTDTAAMIVGAVSIGSVLVVARVLRLLQSRRII